MGVTGCAEGAVVRLAGVLEYLLCEWLEVAAPFAYEENKTSVHERHLKAALTGDDELRHVVGKYVCK